MITAEQAVKNAVSFFNRVSTTAPRGLRVEEVKLSGDEKCWLITLGLLGDKLVLQPRRTEPMIPIRPHTSEALAHRSHEREYKLFRVRRDDGTVEDMTIRSLSAQ